MPYSDDNQQSYQHASSPAVRYNGRYRNWLYSGLTWVKKACGIGVRPEDSFLPTIVCRCISSQEVGFCRRTARARGIAYSIIVLDGSRNQSDGKAVEISLQHLDVELNFARDLVIEWRL